MLEESCLGMIRAHGLLVKGDKVLVAISGGPDSVSLLHFLHSVADEFGIWLCAAHVNHMLRGKQSDEDAEFSRALCESLGVPVSVRCLDVKALSQKTGLGTQEAARMGRYEILVEEAINFGATKIAVGQNLDDQVETVLQRLLRGAGPEGVAGIWPSRKFVTESGKGPVNLIRPLLGTTRQEIMEYIERHGLCYRVDPSNLKPVYTRNSIRLKLVPFLREYNKDVDRAIARFAELLREQNELFEELAAPLRGLLHVSESVVRVPLADLLKHSRAAQRYIVRKAVERAKGDLRRLYLRHVDAILSVAANNSGAIDVPGARAQAYGGWLVIKPVSAEQVPDWKARTLVIPGVTSIPEIGKKITASVLDLTELDVDPSQNKDRSVAYVDFEKVIMPIIIRKRRPGDAFRPLGMQGTKKLNDYLISKHIRRENRDQIPVLVSGDDSIVWVGGLQIDDRFKVTEATRTILKLEIMNG